MAAAAIVWLGYETFRFFLHPVSIGSRPIHPGGLDLRMFHSMVNAWFAGEPVYTGEMGYLYTHPPASMVLIWPVYGWHAMETTVIVWTVTAAAGLAWLIHLVVRQSGAETPLEQAFVALVPIAIYPTGAVIGNGQLVLQIFPMLIAGLLLLRGGPDNWRRNLGAAVLILLALAKPIIAAPFFWIVIFAASSLRPALFVVAGYLALTLFAASFQEAGTIELLRQFLARAYVTSVGAGEANVQILLSHMGLKEWAAPASLTILFLLGIWVWRHRRDDLWLLVGVTALVARFWSYHRWYDDLLILLPMVTLFRIAKIGPTSRGMDVAAGLLFGFTLVFMMVPGGLYLLPPPWNNIYSIVQAFIWMADLAFLLYWRASTAKQWRSESQISSARRSS
jgi:hypothetical protein